MDNVIQFPNSNTDPQFVKSEEERLAKVKQYQIDLCLDHSIDLTYAMLEQIQSKGIELNQEDIDQHILMVAESVKALMLKGCGVRHPLHKITAQIVNKEESKIFRSTWQSEMFEE